MINCCRDCVAPKRHVGCHSDCPDYLEEKRIHDERKAEIDKQRQVILGIRDSRTRVVSRALKRKGKLK